uniref:Protein amnionless n=1 Tax=Anopheles christyi TaxID=43041 RepID=A0A182KBH7_9DIPT
MLTVSILALAVLLSDPKALCGPATNDSSTGQQQPHWGRVYGGPTALSEEDRFYTLDYTHTTVRPRARASRTSTGWRREPRFISFETKDNSIEVEIDFAIPFLSIPVQKSMNGVMSSVLKVSIALDNSSRRRSDSTRPSGTPLLNVNLGAVAVAGALTVGGALIGAIARSFPNSTSNSSTTTSWPSLLSLGGPRSAESKARPEVVDGGK